MKRIEYTLTDIKKNIKNNKKIVIYIFTLCVLAGIVIGLFQLKSYDQPQYHLDDTIVEKVHLDSLQKNETYYYTAFIEIKEKYGNLKAYVQYLKQVEITGESREQLSYFEEELYKFNQLYTDLSDFYYGYLPIIYDDISKAEEFARKHIDESQKKIEESNRLLDTITNKSFTREFVTTSETNALNKIMEAEEEVEIWNKQLSVIRTYSSKQSENINNEMDQKLSNTTSKLNYLVESFNKVIYDIETREQYDIVYNKFLLKSYNDESGLTSELTEDEILNNKKNNAIIYAKSIAGLDLAKERFYSTITFFVLFGITISLLYGAVKTNKRGEK